MLLWWRSWRRIGQCKTLTLRNLSRRMSSGNTPLFAASTGMPLIAAITRGSSFAGENKKKKAINEFSRLMSFSSLFFLSKNYSRWLKFKIIYSIYIFNLLCSIYFSVFFFAKNKQRLVDVIKIISFFIPLLKVY